MVFAHMMGIHPEGAPESTAHLPVNVDDALDFYTAFSNRHYVDDGNPEGVALAGANVTMLRERIPRVLRLFGLGLIPRIVMRELMGDEMCARLKVQPVPGDALLRRILTQAFRILPSIAPRSPGHHAFIGRLLFQTMIDDSYGGEVRFTVPTTMSDLRKMTEERVLVARGAHA
jgi:hypothetical protein